MQRLEMCVDRCLTVYRVELLAYCLRVYKVAQKWYVAMW